MKTKFFFTTIIIIIIAVLHAAVLHVWISKIAMQGCMAVIFVTWIYIDCDPDEEDNTNQKLYWVLSSTFLFIMFYLLNHCSDNKNVKDAAEFASYVEAQNLIFSLLTII